MYGGWAALGRDGGMKMFAYILTTAILSLLIVVLNLFNLVVAKDVKTRVLYVVSIVGQAGLAIWGFSVLFQ